MWSTDDGEVGEGIAIAIEGNTHIDTYHGFEECAEQFEGAASVKFAGMLYTTRWRTMLGVNGGEIQKAKLERDVYRNLPASTVGPFTG